MKVDWSTIKQFIDERDISIQWVDMHDTYFLKALDGFFSLECEIIKDEGPNQLDFETSYKVKGNKTPKSEILVSEENIKTGGHFQYCSFFVDVPASIGWASDKIISFPIPVSILSSDFVDREEYRGDSCELQIAPDTPVGALTIAASLGDKVLTVSQTVIDNISIGYYVTIDSLNAGRVLNIDKANSKITVENEMDQAYAVGTLVKQTIKMVPTLEFNGGNSPRLLGESKIGGSYLPANTPMVFKYYNSTIIAKRFVFGIDYLY